MLVGRSVVKICDGKFNLPQEFENDIEKDSKYYVIAKKNSTKSKIDSLIYTFENNYRDQSRIIASCIVPEEKIFLVPSEIAEFSSGEFVFVGEIKGFEIMTKERFDEIDKSIDIKELEGLLLEFGKYREDAII